MSESTPPRGERRGDATPGISGRIVKIVKFVGVGALVAIVGYLVRGGMAIGDAQATLRSHESRLTKSETKQDAQDMRLDKLQTDVAFMRGGLEARFNPTERAAAERAESDAKAKAAADRAVRRDLPGAP
jgi:hypothetical protein